MNRTLFFLLGIFGLGISSIAADVTGSVSYKGAPPKKEYIKMNADPVCLKESKDNPVPKEDIVVNGTGLANVFVYIKEGAKKDSTPPSEPVTLDQNTCHYVPHVIGIRVGQPFKIVNSDPTLHNVNAQAKVNSKFNAGMPTKGQTIEKKFTKPEQMIKVKCDVHGWMNAYIGVMDHPYFAVTDSSGSFSLKDVPAGDYTVEAWHEKLGSKTMKLTVAATVGKADFQF